MKLAIEQKNISLPYWGKEDFISVTSILAIFAIFRTIIGCNNISSDYLFTIKRGRGQD